MKIGLYFLKIWKKTSVTFFFGGGETQCMSQYTTKKPLLQARNVTLLTDILWRVGAPVCRAPVFSEHAEHA